MVKTMVSTYLPKQKELENLCSIVAVHQRNFQLWPLAHVMLKRLFAIDVSLWISTLLMVMLSRRRNNLPNNPFLSSWQT